MGTRPRSLLFARAVSAFMMLAWAPYSRACTVCNSADGEQVRNGIVGDSLSVGMLATLLPFAFAAGAVAVVHFGGSSRRQRDGTR